MPEKKYRCVKCGREAEGAKAPACCGENMKPVTLDVCTSAPSAEHSRPMEEDEPCDDSRGG